MKRIAFVLVLSLVILAGCSAVPEAPVATAPVGPTVSEPALPAASPTAASIEGAEASPTATGPTGEPTKAEVAEATPEAATEPVKITLAMGYIPSVQFAPLYVAQEKGYFADEGLDVTFQYGIETDLMKLVGTDKLQFMLGSGEEIVIGRSQGLPVRYVARWYRQFPAVLFAKADSGIKSPADLIGKTVGVPGLFGANYVGWEAIVYATGLDAKGVTLQSVGFTQAAAVSQGQVDAAMDYIVNGPVQLTLDGQDVTVIPVSDYVDLPSNGLITNEQTIEAHPEWVQSMVTALLRGLVDTLSDPDFAFQASLRAVPEAGGEQEKVSRAIFDASVKLWQAEPDALGVSDPEAWAKAATFMKEMDLIQQAVDAEECYTNDFVVQK